MKQIYILNLFLFFWITGYSQTFDWAKSVGGSNNDNGNSLYLDDAGNIYIIGSFYGTVDFDPGPGVFNLTSSGQSDAFLMKLNNIGDFDWAVKMGGTGFDEGISVEVDNSGNVYVQGFFEGTVDFDPGPGVVNLISAGQTDVFICKLSVFGNLIWAKSISGTSFIHTYSMKLEGNYIYSVGSFYQTADFDPTSSQYNITSQGQSDTYICKWDTSGSFVWAKSVGGILNVAPASITITSFGNILIGGRFYNTVDFDPSPIVYNVTSSGEDDIYILNLDQNGNFVWVKTFGGTDWDKIWSIDITNTGKIIATGAFRGTSDFDPGPGIYNLISAGANNLFILQLDSSGNFEWAHSIGALGSQSGFSITSDAYGNIYVTGYYFGTVDFNPGTAIFNLTSNGLFDLFILKLNGSGIFDWVISMGGVGVDIGRSIRVDDNGNIFTTGTFQGTVDFDHTPSVFNLSALGDDVFIHKLKQNLINIDGVEISKGISIFPNPTNDVIIIDAEKEIGEINIFDVAGKLMQYKFIKDKNVEIDIKELNAGIYFIEIENRRVKFVKM